MARKDSKPASDDKAFRFMDLPREIRDAISDEVVVDIAANSKILYLLGGMLDEYAPVPYPDDEVRWTLQNVPVASCFTVNQQFSREYKESLERNKPTMTLKMTDHYGFSRKPIIPKDILQHTQNFEFQFIVGCEDYLTYHSGPPSGHLPDCECWWEMEAHVSNLARNFAMHISAIGSCQVELCLLGPRMMDEDFAGLESTLTPLTRMAGVKSIKILHFPDHTTGDETDFLHDYEPVDAPYASWSSEAGWEHHEIEAVP